MKLFLTIVITFIGFAGGYAQIPDTGLVKAVAIVDGMFFDKSAPTKDLIPGGSTMAILKDPENTGVIAVYLPDGFELDESIKSMAIPAERVMFAGQLLKDYDDHRPKNVATYKAVGVKEGEPMVKFEYRDTDNNVWSNEVLNGKIYVINLWQRECGPCRREMPVLSQWKERFADVVFLSASRHDREEILPIVEQYRFTWNHLQEAADLVALVGDQGFPLTIVVDKNGIVRFAKVGASEENQAEAIAVIEELVR